jgi:hypothetical protein
VASIIEHANRLRFAVDEDTMKKDSIFMSEKWKQELEEMPFTSKVKGRMSHLLKMKSKVRQPHKDRVKHDPFEFNPVRKMARGNNTYPKEEAKKPEDTHMQSQQKKIIKPTLLERYADQQKKNE